MCGEPSASHDSLARGIPEGGVGHQGAKPPGPPSGSQSPQARGDPGGPRPLPRAAPAMNGQLGFSCNRRHPSPDRGPPALLPSQGGEREAREANKPQGACLTLGEGAAPGAERGVRPGPPRTPPPPGLPPPPPPRLGGLAAAGVGTGTPSAPGAARERREHPRVRAPRPYLLFHVPQQLFFDCVLCAAHGAAGGGQAAPGGPPIPRLPSPPPRLPAQRPTREAEPPPAALPARRRRSHCPVLSSAAIFRAPQTSGSRPGPFPQPAGRGCVRRDWGGEGGVRAGADAWGRRARARAAGTVVMATGRLPPRGREPAL